nr:MAG TPA: hypothetical protein [Caudoviricetes sp.]
MANSNNKEQDKCLFALNMASFQRRIAMAINEFERRVLNELKNFRENYCRDNTQLDEIHSRLRARCTQLSVGNGNSQIDSILKTTIECDKNIEEALHKLQEATGKIQKYIELTREYFETDF